MKLRTCYRLGELDQSSWDPEITTCLSERCVCRHEFGVQMLSRCQVRVEITVGFETQMRQHYDGIVPEISSIP